MPGKNKEKIYEMLNRVFPSCCNNAMSKEFGDQDFRTEWNIFSASLITTWYEGLPKRAKQKIKNYCDAYSKGFTDAIQQSFLVEDV